MKPTNLIGMIAGTLLSLYGVASHDKMVGETTDTEMLIFSAAMTLGPMLFIVSIIMEARSQGWKGGLGHVRSVNTLMNGAEIRIVWMDIERNEAIIAYLKYGDKKDDHRYIQGNEGIKLIPEGAGVGTVCVTIDGNDGKTELRIVEEKKSS